MMIIKASAIISLIASISLVLTTFGIQESFAEENISDMSNNKFENLFEAKITEIVNGELIIRSYYFATPEEAERFEQMMQNTGDATYYQLEIIGEEIIDGKTKLVAKAIPVTFTKYTDNTQKPVPEGYIPYKTPKISPELQEILDSEVERVDVRIVLKNTPKPPPDFLKMTDEEQVANRQERYAQIRMMQQDLVDYITNNDGVVIKQLEFINSVYADVSVTIIDELKNRDDILTMDYYDENVKVISSGDYVSPQINDTTPATSIENRWYVKLIHEDIVLDFEITSEDNKPVRITIPNYIVLEDFDITVNDKTIDYSIAQGNDTSLLLITLQNDDKDNKTSPLPPRKQLKQGVSPSDVECNEGLELIFKSRDNSPVCVKPSTAEKLIERGWAVTEAHKNVTNGEAYVSGQVISKSDVSTIPDSPISDGLVLAVALEHMASLLEKPVDILADQDLRRVGISLSENLFNTYVEDSTTLKQDGSYALNLEPGMYALCIAKLGISDPELLQSFPIGISGCLVTEVKAGENLSIDIFWGLEGVTTG